MKKVLGLSIAVVLIIGLVGGGTWAYFSDIETTSGTSTQICTVEVFDYWQGPTAGGGAITDPERTDPNDALGAPDDDFYSLGFGGWIVLDFGVNVCNELTVWEVTWGGGGYPDETATVEISGSPDGVTWIDLGTATNAGGVSHATTFTIGDAYIRYVRLTDTSNPADHAPSADGFDLDAVCSWTCVGNIFRAGIIDLELEGGGVIVVDGQISDLKPCQTGYMVIELTATEGSNPMEVWKRVTIDPLDRDENGVGEPECLCAEYGGTWDGSSCSGYTEKNDIDRYIHFDMWIDNDGDPSSFGAGDVWLIQESEGWLLSENLVDFPPVGGSGTNGVNGYWIYLGTLQPGETMVIVQSFNLDCTVGNWAQSDCLTFTEEFFAQQTVSSPPPPGTELPGHGRP